MSPNELPTLLYDLNSVQDKWKTIGMHLHVPLGELSIIPWNDPDRKDHMKQTLENWIKNDKKPTWFILLDVLRRPVIGEEELANNLQTKYCLDPGK